MYYHVSAGLGKLSQAIRSSWQWSDESRITQTTKRGIGQNKREIITWCILLSKHQVVDYDPASRITVSHLLMHTCHWITFRICKIPCLPTAYNVAAKERPLFGCKKRPDRLTTDTPTRMTRTGGGGGGKGKQTDRKRKP